MKNLIIVTGGAGFVGSNLIKLLLKKTNKKIISLDNYSSGTKNNHIFNKRVKYIVGDTKEINKIFFSKKNKIHSIFHFGEFARIYQSFKQFDKCYDSNTIGSKSNNALIQNHVVEMKSSVEKIREQLLNIL